MSIAPLAVPIQDAALCREWLRALPLGNTQLAHADVVTRLGLINRAPIPAAERLRMMELLREPVAFLQGALGRNYHSKPVPFAPLDQAAWDGVTGLWQAMHDGYLRAWEEGGELPPAHRALALHRALRYTAQGLLEHYRAYRDIPAARWEQAHSLMARAEAAGLAAQPVRDSLNEAVETTHCTAAYLQILLVHLANPYQMTPRQLAQVDAWLDRWAGKAVLADAPPRPDWRAGVGRAGPPQHEPPEAAEGWRYLDTESLGKSLLKRLKWLRGGGEPQRAGLGADCAQPACEGLLLQCYRLWCQGRPPRRTMRRRASPRAEVVFGFPGIYACFNDGAGFVAPRLEDAYAWRETEDLRLYGRAASHRAAPVAASGGEMPSPENWAIRDESALGFGLVRHPGKGASITHRQLLAVRPLDGPSFVLGVIRWLSFDDANELQMGVGLLPGVPAPVAARRVDKAAPRAPYHAALLLPEVAALKEPASLLAPLGFYRPGGVAEVAAAGERARLIMRALLEKGADFERIAVEGITSEGGGAAPAGGR